MPGLAGHPRRLSIKQDVDGRDKPGHDVDGMMTRNYFFNCGDHFAGTISEVCWSISKPDSDNFFT